MNDKDLAMELYWHMCRECPNARKCHEECETCDEYEEELEKLERGEQWAN